jgi:3-deoxy-7-phosphoheptulonate synthase
MAIENKVPGKDISDSDLIDKFPLAARKHPGHRSVIEAAGVLFGGKLIPVMAGPNTVENEEMIVKTAKAVPGAKVLRAPREGSGAPRQGAAGGGDPDHHRGHAREPDERGG